MHRKCTAGYKLSRSQEKINHLMYMDDIKLFAKNEKELETLIHAVRIYSQDIGIYAIRIYSQDIGIHAIRIYSQDIGMDFGIEKCAMLVMKSVK